MKTLASVRKRSVVIACMIAAAALLPVYARYKCLSTWNTFLKQLAADSPAIADLLEESSIEIVKKDLHKHYFLVKSTYDEGEVSSQRIPLIDLLFIEDLVRDGHLAVHPQQLSNFITGRVLLTHPKGAGYGGIRISWGTIEFVHGG